MSVVEVVAAQRGFGRQVHKFGGSSLAIAECFHRVKNILEQFSREGDLVVVSASGKTTNHLIEYLTSYSVNPSNAAEHLADLAKFQADLISALVQSPMQAMLLLALQQDVNEIALLVEENFTESVRAKIIGFGEIWSARLLSTFLSQEGLAADVLDARQFLRAEYSVQPEIDFVASQEKLAQCLVSQTSKRLVITGFMAQDFNGNTVLLGRNGSDYSATMIGALVNAQNVTIWSDVAGVFSADPRQVPDACLLPLIRLDEASELARLAAPVLHTRTLQPIAKSAVELHLRCSYALESGSTKIERILASGRGAKVVTSLDDVCMLQIEVPRSQDFEATKQEVANLLSRYQMLPLVQFINEEQKRIQLMYTPEVIDFVFGHLQNANLTAEMFVRTGFSLIAAVGAGITANPNHCHGFYQQLRDQPVEFIAETESGLSLVAILRKIETSSVIAAIHRVLFQARKTIGVVLLGKGNIGSRFLSLLSEQQLAFEKRHNMQLSLISVSDSSKHWVDFQGIDASLVMAKFDENASEYDGDEWLENIKLHPFDELVIMDVTACQSLAYRYERFAEQGYHLISANKFAGSSSRVVYDNIKNAFRKTSRTWLYNATVGAGLPINYAVRDLINSGDAIIAISGIFSGTLSWLFQHYSGDIAFSDRLEQAWQQGLTEPDPRQDLSGLDVMRKLVILGRDAGLAIEPEQVEIQSLVPENLKNLPLDEFFEQAYQIDEVLAPWRKRAEKEDGVLRYVARLGRDGHARVGLEVIAKDNPLANLFPCDNFFAIESYWYRDNPLVIQGPGAGRDVTAGALVSDLNRLAILIR